MSAISDRIRENGLLRTESRTPATHSVRRLRNSGVSVMFRAFGNRRSMSSMPCLKA
jgi:hypothetical protein